MAKKTDPLLAYRQKHDLTQEQLARRLRISRALVSKLESGRGSYTAEMATHIERKLGIDRAEMRPDLWEPMAA